MKEALKLALEWAESHGEIVFAGGGMGAVTGMNAWAVAVKEALAPLPEQEPVAWMVYTQEGQSVYVTDNPTDLQESQRALPLYTTPPKRPWVGLTDKQILADETLRYYFGQNGGAGPVSKQGRKIVDAIEAAHGIKE